MYNLNKSFYLLILILIFSSQLSFASNFDNSYKDYSNVLTKYVNKGLVDYKNLKNNSESLEKSLTEISKVEKSEYNEWRRDEKLAFLINLYNATTLKLIIDNYPLKSIRDIETPWALKIVKLFGSNISLDILEHEVIRKEFNEPRIHFVLVCAAKGCPILSSEPYKSTNLESQLDNATKTFLSDNTKNYIDNNKKVINLSPVFDWFKDDFTKKYGSVNKFLEPYFLNEKIYESEFSKFSIKYTTYDWSLNEQS